MYVCMYVCMYIYIYICMYTHTKTFPQSSPCSESFAMEFLTMKGIVLCGSINVPLGKLWNITMLLMEKNTNYLWPCSMTMLVITRG